MLRDTPVMADEAPIRDSGMQALGDAARSLLARGNTLLRKEHGSLQLRACVAQRPAASLTCIGLEGAQAQLLIGLEREPSGSPLGDAQWQDYDGEARLLAWSLAHEPMLEALGRVFGGGFIATRFGAAGVERDCLWLMLAWQGEDGQSAQGWLGLRASAAGLLAMCPDWQRDPSQLSLLGDATALHFDLLLRGRPLDAASVAQLAPGDVWLIGEAAHCDAYLQPDRATSRGMFGLPAGWTVQRRDQTWTIGVNPLATGETEAARPRFRLARLSLSPQEVGTLQAGSVLAYDAALLGSTVDILLGERRLGEGAIVALGEWLGVRISQRSIA
jgi:hypothetical protein